MEHSGDRNSPLILNFVSARSLLISGEKITQKGTSPGQKMCLQGLCLFSNVSGLFATLNTRVLPSAACITPLPQTSPEREARRPQPGQFRPCDEGAKLKFAALKVRLQGGGCEFRIGLVCFSCLTLVWYRAKPLLFLSSLKLKSQQRTPVIVIRESNLFQ